MSLTTPEPKQFELPDPGNHHAEITEVRDLGEVDTFYGRKPKIALILRLDQEDSKGVPIELQARFNLAGGPKASLTKALIGILGSDPGPLYDLRQLVGKSVEIVVVHSEPNPEGRVFANITTFFQPRPKHAIPTGTKVDRAMGAIRDRQQKEKKKSRSVPF